MRLFKCRFFYREVLWLGHVIAEGTLKVDPRKVEAIRDFPDPTDKKGLIRLLGMVTYLDRFCKDLAVLTRPLRDVLKEESTWVWGEQQKTALSALKEAMLSLPVLRLYDPAVPMVMSVDASPIGLGAALLQEGQPLAYLSTSLTATQSPYFQIEKELLAVLFGLRRFRQYTYGQTVIV